MARVGIIGTRGIPNGHGGFERFVETLVEHRGWRDTGTTFAVYGEGPDRPFNAWTDLRCVGVVKDARPFRYYFRSALLAADECDIIVCCGVGISIFAYWPRLKGKAFVLNPDGCEWRRTKWSTAGRLAIRAMYAPALSAAQRVVVDAEALREDFGLGDKAQYIAYAAPEPVSVALEPSTSEKLELTKPYVLAVARLEPENNVQIVTEAFRKLGRTDVELLVVGGTGTAFFASQLAKFNGDGIRFLGPIYDQEVLNQLRSNALAYFHGHSVGGTNPSLLEALATVRGQMICHDNKYNREVAGEQAFYVRDADDLASRLGLLCDDAVAGTLVRREPSRDERFHPDTIHRRYRDLFETLNAAG